MKAGETSRGFAFVQFADSHGVTCSLQKSSSAAGDAIWLGVDEAAPRILASQAAAHGVQTHQRTGWVPYPIPGAVSVTTSMHLAREQVAELLPALVHFVHTGDLPPLPSKVVRRDCADCTHSIDQGGRWCVAPQLAEYLDSSQGHKNEITPCEGVRDFKHACGHAARWFQAREAAPCR